MNFFQNSCTILDTRSTGFLSTLQLSRKSKRSTSHRLLSDLGYAVMINSHVLWLTGGLSSIRDCSRILDVCCKAQLIFSSLLG